MGLNVLGSGSMSRPTDRAVIRPVVNRDKEGGSMDIVGLVSFVLTWGLTGSGVITLYLVIAWQTGLLTGAKDPEGAGRERLGAAGIAAVLGSILLYLVMLCVADGVGLAQTDGLTFGRLWAFNFLVYFFWLVYDTFVLDILLVIVWRPGFLTLPDPQAHGSAAYHLSTIPRGMIFGAVVSLVATTVSWFVVLG